MSLRIIKRSASTLLATRALSLSLSPKAEPISSVLTQSFSFMTGMTPRFRSFSMAFCRLRYDFLLLSTSAVSRTCAMVTSCFENAFR